MVNMPLGTSTQIVGKFDSTDSSLATLRSGELGVEHKLDDHWRVAVGTRVDDRENVVPNASEILSQNGRRTDVAVTVGYQPAPGPVPSSIATAPGAATPGATAPGAKPANAVAGPNWDVYAFVQDTAVHTETRPENDRAGVGGSYQISSAARLGAEASDGSLGLGGKVSTDYHIDDHSNVYVNYTLAADQPDALNVGRQGTLTTGTRYRFDDVTSVYGEERLQSGTGSDTLTRAYGVDFSPSKQWTYGFKFEHGTVSDPFQGDIALSAVSGTVQYTQGQIKYGGALEWRRDDSSLTGASHTALTRNSLSYQVDPDWKLFGKVNWSKTDGPASPALDASFHEIVLGAAWRPVKNDRWNTLFKFTVLDDQPSEAQLSTVGNTIDFAQRSRVADIDATYQLSKWLALGGKYAVRTGDLKPTQTAGDWFASQAQLWIARADVLFPNAWDAMIELRRLSIRETDDHRLGFLLGGYRHVGGHMKIGAGYNFTNYSDELTDVSYRSHGFFVNMIGKF
jgi:hypothetical protein